MKAKRRKSYNGELLDIKMEYIIVKISNFGTISTESFAVLSIFVS